MAAMAISSLSFSRGVRCIDPLSSARAAAGIRPVPAATMQDRAASPRHCARPAVPAQFRSRWRSRPRRKIPRASAIDCGHIGRQRQYGSDRTATGRDRGAARAELRLPLRARIVSAKTNSPARRTRQRSTRRPLRHRFTHGGPTEHQRLGNQQPPIGRDIDVDPAPSRASSNRIVSCGSQPACAIAVKAELDVDRRVVVERPIDLFGGRRGHGEPALAPTVMSKAKRSPPAMPPAVLTITASSAWPAGKARPQRTVS